MMAYFCCIRLEFFQDKIDYCGTCFWGGKKCFIDQSMTWIEEEGEVVAVVVGSKAVVAHHGKMIKMSQALL